MRGKLDDNTTCSGFSALRNPNGAYLKHTSPYRSRAQPESGCMAVQRAHGQIRTVWQDWRDTGRQHHSQSLLRPSNPQSRRFKSHLLLSTKSAAQKRAHSSTERSRSYLDSMAGLRRFQTTCVPSQTLEHAYNSISRVSLRLENNRHSRSLARRGGAVEKRKDSWWSDLHHVQHFSHSKRRRTSSFDPQQSDLASMAASNRVADHKRRHDHQVRRIERVHHVERPLRMLHTCYFVARSTITILDRARKLSISQSDKRWAPPRPVRDATPS
jgi:hypothetical protein